VVKHCIDPASTHLPTAIMHLRIGGLLFSVLAPQLVSAADADNCLGSDCAATGRSVLQKREVQDQLSVAVLPTVVERTEVVNGIPIYLKEVDGTPEAEALLQGGGDDVVKKWLLDLPLDWSLEKLHSMNTTLAGFGLYDEWEISGDNIIIVKGTQLQISKFLSSENLPAGSFVEQDAECHPLPITEDLKENSDDFVDADASVPWGLDRIDDKKGLDNSYSDHSPSQGSGVDVYVLDTGVRTTHTDFEGRAVPAYDLWYSPNKCTGTDPKCAADNNGHGTHCAGSIAGSKYGVAKKANIYAVRVLNPRGSYSGIITAMAWVTDNAKKPALMSMSLGGGGVQQSFIRAVDYAKNSGIAVVVAAGNSNSDACKFTPAFVPNSITVGSTDSADKRSGFSNYGTCIDIWAPGSSILSAWKGSDTDTKTISGTSMACPHVSGASALLLSENPTWTVDDVVAALDKMSTAGAISGIPSSPPSPNKFLNVEPVTTTTQPAQPTTVTTTLSDADSPAVVINMSEAVGVNFTK